MSPPPPPGKKRQPLKEAPPPIIIIKRLRHKGGHHGGAWKVAYADFVTTMMALFIVLWAASQSPNVRHSIASYFRNPSMVPGSSDGAGVLPASTGVVAQAEADAGRARTEDENTDDARNLERAAEGIRLELEKDPDLRSISSQVRIEVTPEGLRIQLVERDESLFFEIGSAQVKPALTRVLRIVAVVVGQLPNNVSVEGHTDARQYTQHPRGYSNWELSADRANSARRVLESSGLRARQVTRVVGFADHDLLVDDALDAQNRRVSVIVKRLRQASSEPAVPPVKVNEGLGQMKAATATKR